MNTIHDTRRAAGAATTPLKLYVIDGDLWSSITDAARRLGTDPEAYLHGVLAHHAALVTATLPDGPTAA